MFSKYLRRKIYSNESMRGVPLECQVTVLQVVQDILSKYLEEVSEYLSKEEILLNICGGDENE